MRLWHPAFRVCRHNEPMMLICEGTSQADLWTADIPSLDGSWGNHWPLTWVSSHFSHPFVGLWDPVDRARKYRLRKTRGRGTMWLWGGHCSCWAKIYNAATLESPMFLSSPCSIRKPNGLSWSSRGWIHTLILWFVIRTWRGKKRYCSNSSQGKDFSDRRVLPLPNNPRIVAKPWTSLWRTGIQTMAGSKKYWDIQLWQTTVPIWFCNVISE